MDQVVEKSSYSKIKKAMRYCEKFFAVLSGVSLIAMTLVIFYGVVGRTFGLPVLWTNELASFLMIYITFFAASWILLQDGHVKVDIISSKFNQKWSSINNIIVSIISIIVIALFFWYGFTITLQSFLKGTVLLGPVSWPQYLILLPIPVGSFLLIIRFILNLIDSITILVKQRGTVRLDDHSNNTKVGG